MTFAGGGIICILMHWHFLKRRDRRIFITFNNSVARGNAHKSAYQHQSLHAAEGGVCVHKMHIYRQIIKSLLNLGRKVSVSVQYQSNARVSLFANSLATDCVLEEKRWWCVLTYSG